MPEYLAPGVYVEEVDTGSKPIEGVSTSTAGMVGVTERGPVNVPLLVTSIGDFNRTFGARTDLDDFTRDNRCHGYLPYAVEGFFTNGGKRAYVTRVLPDGARFAERDLFDRGTAASANTLLLRAAPEGSGSAINPPMIYVLDNSSVGAGDWLRIGGDSRAEYRQVVSVAPNPLHLALSAPLDFAHEVTANNVEHIAETVDAAYTTGDFLVDGDTAAGAVEIELRDGTTPADTGILAGVAGQLLRVGPVGVGEYVFVDGTPVALSGGGLRIRLMAPLKAAYADATVVQALSVPAAITTQQLSVASKVGDAVVFLDSLGGGFNAGDLMIIDQAGAHPEVRRIAGLAALSLDVGAYQNYPAGSMARRVTIGDASMTLTNPNPLADARWVTLNDVSTLAVGMRVILDDGGPDEDERTVTGIDAGANNVRLDAAPPPALVGGETVMAVRVLTAVARAGSALIALDNRQMLQSGDVLRIGGAPDEEYVTVAEIMGSRGAAPDAGSVRLSLPLREAYAPGTEVRLQRTPQVDAARQPVFLVVQAAAGTVRLNVAGDDGTAYLAGETVSVAPPSGEIAYHRLTDNDGLTAREVELDEALDYNHVIGEMVAEREQILSVRALDAGAWGNRLAVSVQDEIGGLATGTDVFEMNLPADPALPGTLRVDSLSGIEPGTLLELHHPDSGALGLPPLKVGSVNRSANNLVTLDSGTLTAAHANAFQNAVLAAVSLRALSREFRLAVYLKRKPDPAVPSRNDGLLDSEFFVHLSMDPRHSRYVERIVGTTWEAGDDLDDNGEPLRVSDRRSQGESAYIRVRDLAANAAEALSIRLGPETLTDLLPGAVVRAARHALADGDDGVSGMDDAMYIGQDSDEPLERTGLFSLRNIENISIIACPGQTTAVLQQALIDHCENMRYRFAVLDGPRPVNDTLADVLLQRQQFDSKYAALYHPWVMIPDPMPDNLSSIAQVPLPPSGHVLGVFARTDIERGVHKAPANEVMRGITGLSRSLNKPEHDILNPYPVNINVIRDFRPNNRGIRIWGARVITSDPDYKYVNVRRLLIFLEHSIERGLQWVTFEPNADPLWARVRRTISNFLTTAWRNGALEGTTPKEGFFVRCDRTTMTQDDIDNGRLICVIGVAPVKPAEYVIIRIGLWTANAEQE